MCEMYIPNTRPKEILKPIQEDCRIALPEMNGLDESKLLIKRGTILRTKCEKEKDFIATIKLVKNFPIRQNS